MILWKPFDTGWASLCVWVRQNWIKISNISRPDSFPVLHYKNCVDPGTPNDVSKFDLAGSLNRVGFELFNTPSGHYSYSNAFLFQCNALESFQCLINQWWAVVAFICMTVICDFGLAILNQKAVVIIFKCVCGKMNMNMKHELGAHLVQLSWFSLAVWRIGEEYQGYLSNSTYVFTTQLTSHIKRKQNCSHCWHSYYYY